MKIYSNPFGPVSFRIRLKFKLISNTKLADSEVFVILKDQLLSDLRQGVDAQEKENDDEILKYVVRQTSPLRTTSVTPGAKGRPPRPPQRTVR